MSTYDKETKFYWLQLKEDFFEDDAIEWLEEQEPNGRDYAYFYLKLCLKSLKTNGILIRNVGNILIPYDNKKLAELTRMDFDTVTVAMELLKQIGLVQILENGEIYITQLENLIGSVSKGALKKQQQLALRKNRNNNLETIKDKSNKLLENVIYDETGLPILHKCIRLTREQIQLPTGKVVFVDEKRYGGNGGLTYERANGLCEDCGSSEELRIHHENGYSNNLEDLIILCNSCHGIHHSKKYKELKDGGQGVENIPPKIEYKVKDIIKKEIDNNKLLSTKKSEKFEKPTLEEVQEYCRERNNNIDAQTFIDFYESKGWKIGKSSMKDWKASVRTWENKEKQKQQQSGITKFNNILDNFEKRDD